MEKKIFFPAHKMSRTCKNGGPRFCTDCPNNGKRPVVDALFPNGHRVPCMGGFEVTYYDVPTPIKPKRV